MYYPRATHKRPIVLIGPPNIGRHELRQRLMADSERFSAAVPRKFFRGFIIKISTFWFQNSKFSLNSFLFNAKQT